MESIAISGIYARCLVRGLVVLLPILLFFPPVPARSGEDVLRLLIWEGYAPEQYVEEFERHIEVKYGRKVKLQVSVIEGPEDFYGPIRMKSVDVVTITHHHFKDERYNYIANNLLLPIDTRNLPNFQHVIPTLREADYLSSDGKTYGIPICKGPYGLAYSTEKIGRLHQEIAGSWDPVKKQITTIFAMQFGKKSTKDVR